MPLVKEPTYSSGQSTYLPGDDHIPTVIERLTAYESAMMEAAAAVRREPTEDNLRALNRAINRCRGEKDHATALIHYRAQAARNMGLESRLPGETEAERIHRLDTEEVVGWIERYADAIRAAGPWWYLTECWAEPKWAPAIVNEPRRDYPFQVVKDSPEHRIKGGVAQHQLIYASTGYLAEGTIRETLVEVCAPRWRMLV